MKPIECTMALILTVAFTLSAAGRGVFLPLFIHQAAVGNTVYNSLSIGQGGQTDRPQSSHCASNADIPL